MSHKLDDKLVSVLRQQGKNPTALQKELDTVIASGDMRKKAGLLEHYAALTDRVRGNSAATSFLTSRRRLLDVEDENSKGSVSGTQALVGLTGNGFVDLAESLPKLAVAAYQGVKGDNKSWEKANKSVENFFQPLRTYVSDDYQKGLAWYDSERGLDLNLDAKSLIGTVGNLAGFILPGFLTAGMGSLATIGTRSALRAAQLAGDTMKVAQASAKLGKAGSIVEKVTGISSFLQMFPGYQKEAIEAGLSMKDATLLAIPMAGINGWIETANMGALTKALGMSDDIAKQAIREVTTQELRSALQGMAGKALNPTAFMDVAEGAAKAALGRISRPKEMSMVGRMLGAASRRVGTGFREQGITEGGEEFFQSLVENASRQLYNNFGAATSATEGNGKFKDPTLGKYLFDGIYGTLLGTIVGTGMGTIVQSKKLDPTVFGYINADVRMQLAKGVAFDDVVNNLKINKALDAEVAGGRLKPEEHQELKQTIVRMADTAREFADVDGFTDSDRYLMFKLSESRNTSIADSANIEALKEEYGQITFQLQSGQLSTADQLKAELRKSAVAKELGGFVADPNGNPTQIFEAEKFVSDRASDFETIASQTLAEYGKGTDRAGVKNFFNNNYSTWQKKYGKLSQYEDPFTPQQVVVDPATQESIGFDADKKFFRIVSPVGGQVKTPAHVNEQGKFVPSVRGPLGYDYGRPIDDINRHIALSQTLADPADPLSQSATPFEPADNSPEANWLRDGEELINTITVGSAAGKSAKAAVGKAKQLATAFLTDSAFLANDAKYGQAYTQMAATLQGLVSSASAQTTVPGTQTGSATSTASAPVATVHQAQLPKDLAGAKPRYGYQGTNFLVRFASDVDRALYVTSQTVPSKRDAEYRRFLTRLGYTNSEINREGVAVRNAIKAKAQSQVLNGAQSGDTLKISQPIAAEPASTRQTADSSQLSVVPTTPPDANQSAPVQPDTVTQPTTDGQTTQPGNAPSVQQSTPEPQTIDAQYEAAFELDGSIKSAADAEAEFEQALDASEQSVADDGIPVVGTIEQLIDALERTIAATAEATGATGTDINEESVDQADTPDAGISPAASTAEVVLPEGPLTLQDALTALRDARGQAAADQFENALMKLLRFPKFLQDSMLFYALPPEPTTATGKVSTKRRPKKDIRMRLPLDYFYSAAEILAGQRKEQTSPAANEVLRKFLAVFLEGGVEIDDRTTGQRAYLSLDELADTAAVMEDMIPDGVEDIHPLAYLAADEILSTLSEEDIDAILSVIDEMEGINPDSWLVALNDALENAFPPVADSVLNSIDAIVQEYRDANESIIFDNADDADPEYQRVLSEYTTTQRGIQSAIANRQTENAVSPGLDDFESDGALESGVESPSIQSGLAAAGEEFQPETSEFRPEQFESAVKAAEDAGRAAIEKAGTVGDATDQTSPQSADPVTETFESAIAALEDEEVAKPLDTTYPDRLTKLRETAAKMLHDLENGIYKVPNTSTALRIVNGEVVESGNSSMGQFQADSRSIKDIPRDELAGFTKKRDALRAQVAKLNEPWLERLVWFIAGKNPEEAKALLRGAPEDFQLIARLVDRALLDIGNYTHVPQLMAWLDAKEAETANPAPTTAEKVEQLLDAVEEAISQEASQDPITSAAVAPLDIELADLNLQEKQLSDQLGDDDTRKEIEAVQEKKKTVRRKKADVAQEVASQPAPVDTLQQKLDDLDEEEIALAKRLSAKLKAMRSGLNANPFADPELMGIVGEYFAVKIKKGIYGFAKIARDFVRANQEALHPDDFKVLRGVYGYYRDSADDAVSDQMDDTKAVRAITLESINEVLSPAAEVVEPVQTSSEPVEQTPDNAVKGERDRLVSQVNEALDLLNQDATLREYNFLNKQRNELFRMETAFATNSNDIMRDRVARAEAKLKVALEDVEPVLRSVRANVAATPVATSTAIAEQPDVEPLEAEPAVEQTPVGESNQTQETPTQKTVSEDVAEIRMQALTEAKAKVDALQAMLAKDPTSMRIEWELGAAKMDLDMALANATGNAKSLPPAFREQLNQIQAELNNINRLIDKIYDTTGETEKDQHELGSLAPGRKFKEALKKLSRQMAARLGWKHEYDANGRVEYSWVNLPPAGGYGGFKLWHPSWKIGIEVQFVANKLGGRGGDYGDTLTIDDRVRWRLIEPVEKNSVGENRIYELSGSPAVFGDKVATAANNYLSSLPDDGTRESTNTLDSASTASTGLQFGLFEGNNAASAGTVTGSAGRGGKVSPNRTGSTGKGKKSGGSNGNSAGNLGGTLDAGSGSPADGGSGISEDSGTGQTAPVELPATESSNTPAVVETAPVFVPAPEINLNPNHFVITDDTVLIPQGRVGKIRANLAAIKLMKELVEAGRPATAEEKAVLVQYTGWGGLKAVLDQEKLNRYKMAVENLSNISYSSSTYWLKVKGELQSWYDTNGKFAEEISDLLTKEEFQDAVNSVINAHYTDRPVIKAIWKYVQAMGFKGGHTLEPATGAGHFLGLMPVDLVKKSQWWGTELDTVTGNIAKLLYPDADIQVKGFEAVPQKSHFYDLVISNVPFGQTAPFDSAHQDLSKFNLHNYFIAKSIRLAKPGGLVAVVTSAYTMDSTDTSFREWVSNNGNADLVGAIRLPSNAFLENAGTEVVTDILFFRKRDGSETEPGESMRSLKPLFDQEWDTGQLVKVKIDGVEQSVPDVRQLSYRVNEYFARNPEKMLGEPKFAFDAKSGGLYRPDENTLEAPEGQDTMKLLDEQLDSLPKNITETKGLDSRDASGGYSTKRAGALYRNAAGKIVKSADGVEQALDLSSTVKIAGKKYTLKTVYGDYLDLKEGVQQLRALEAKATTEAEGKAMTEMRRKLRLAYTTFVAKYGTLNRNAQRIGFLEDADVEYAQVAGLELVSRDPVTNKYSFAPSQILNQRVQSPPKLPTTAENVQDALTLSLAYKTKIDLPWMAELLNQPENSIQESLLVDGLAFVDPETGLLDDKENYLSGNVRHKLAQAKAVAQTDQSYEPNVVALEAVIPKTIPISLIDFRIGSSWIPSQIYEDFMAAIGINQPKVAYLPATQSFSISGWPTPRAETLGTPRINVVELIDKALNLKQPVIMDRYKDENGNKKEVKNIADTAAAQDKMMEVMNRFVDYVKDMPSLARLAESVYNEKYNSLVAKKYMQPPFTSFPGANPAIQLRQHQIKAAQRALVDSVLFAHGVGTGKTFTMITAAMEMKRLGLAQKPMIVVQNSTLENFANAWRFLYPGANILVPTGNDTDAENRQRFLQRMAYNNWDGVIIPQSFLALIPDNQDRVDALVQEQIDVIQNALNDTDEKEERATAQNLKARLKALEKQRDSAAEKEAKKKQKTVADKAREALKVTKKVSKQAARRTDATMTFEELGVDALFIDEAHEYKKFGFYTKMGNVKGIDTASSQKALSAMLKVKWVQERNKGRNVVLATGTPISNTMAELWTMLKYVAPQLVKDFGIDNFDEFAANFGSVDPSLEFTAAGKFKIVDRFKRYINMPELNALFKQNVDVVLGDEVFKKGDNTLPELKDGKFTFIELDMSPELKNYMDYVKRTLTAWEKLEGAEKRKLKHIPLVMFTRAKQAAIDVRLVDPAMKTENSKVHAVAKEVLQRYKQTASYKGTQLIFSNSIASAEAKDKYLDEEMTMINPLYGKDQFNLYDAIVDELVSGGIPRAEIAIVPEDAKKREAVFLKVRSGEIRVVLGSTERLGVGVNIQDRIQAVHHVDAPVRPMDFEQRNGRILRQGNLHAEWGLPVEIVTYGVKKTLDATAYQRLAFKQEFINQILKGDSTERSQNDEADEDDASSMGFQEMMASLSGSQYVQLQQQRKFELNKVKMALSNWERGQIEARQMIESAERSVAKYTALIPQLELQIGAVQKAFPDGKVEVNTIQVENGDIIEGEKAKDALAEVMSGLLADAVQKLPSSRFVKINGFGVKMGWTIAFDHDRGRDGVSIYYEKGENFKGLATKVDGLLTSMRAALKRVESAPSIARSNMEKSQETIEAFTQELKRPFKDTAKLAALEAEVADLEEKMQAEFEAESAELENGIEEGEFDLDNDLGFQLQQPSQPANPATDALVNRIAQAFPSTQVVSNPAAYESALIESGASDLLGNQRPLGFVWNNRVFLSPDATENTVLHEFGHIWTNIVKTQNPAFYQQGIALVANSPYMARVKADSYYSTLSEEQQLDEALAMAIGDEGVGFLQPAGRMSFGEWLMNLWNQLKQAFGLGTDPAKMTLRDFVGQVVGQMTPGTPVAGTSLDGAAADASQSSVNSVPQFQLPTGVVPQTIAEMKTDAESRFQSIPVLAIGAGVNPDLWDTPVREWTKEDKAYVKNIKQLTGWELSGPETLKYTRPGDLFYLADGSAVRMEGYQLTQILRDGFQAAYESDTGRGRLFRTVVDRMKSWTNLETFLDMIDDAAGSIAGLMKDLKRTSARRASYAQVILEPLRQDAEKKLADFSLRTGNSLETVKTMTVTTYDYDETGAVVDRDVEIPVAVGMELALLAETQIETYGQASHIVDGMPTLAQLYRTNPDGSRTRWKKGAVYYDQDNDTTHYLLMPTQQLNALRERFETGNGAYEGEADAYTALKTYYNQAEVVKLLKEENGYLNPDREFEEVQDYYPIRTYNNQQDARTQSRGFSRTLDESRQLIARQNAADAVLVRDPITTMNDYEGSVVDILEHGRLVENLNALKNGIESDYTGPKKQYLITTIEKQRDVLQNHRKKRAEAYEQRGFVHWLESSMRRYTQSVFSLNVGLPLKQTGTYAAALGQGIIADEFLHSGEACGVLTQLTAGAYRDWEAPSTVINGMEHGYRGSLSGMDTQERPLMEEIFGVGMTDELTKSRQIQRFATILDRMTHSQTLFTGDVEWSDLGLNSRTLTNGQKALRQFDEWNTEYGLAAMKRADRAVILAYYTAAKLQANSEGLAEGSDQYWDRVADLTERTLYATNQMSNLAEQTPMQTSTDFVAKILGLYSGQQQKLLNTVLQSLNRYVKTGEGSSEAKAALVQMAKTFGWAVVFNAAWVAGISAGSAALMAILSGDEPKSWEETKRRIGFDFVRNIAGTVPGLGQQAVEYYLSQMDDRPGTDPLLQITAAENLQTGLDILSGMGKYLMEEDEQRRDKALDSVIYDTTDFMTKASGTPASVTKLVREWITTDADDLEDNE
ncbi:helicase-related protein [Spirosoma fluviale]|nr:helicase-related protein [Spirosoma fluviale]